MAKEKLVTSRILYPSGQQEHVQPTHGQTFSLKELQKIVGGYIEIVQTVDPDYLLVINEDGKLKGLPINDEATMLYRYGAHDPIVGTVLLCRSNQIN